MSIIHSIRTWRTQRACARRTINQTCCDYEEANPSKLDRLEAIARIDYSDEAIAERLLALIQEEAAATYRRDMWAKRAEEDLWMY